MKIVIDDKIPYIKGAFESLAEVVYLPGNKITSGDVMDADAIVTRTRTICNEALLKGSSVKLIATATIGYDHIDTEYCAHAGIEWVNAKGCNSESVNQYIASALFSWAAKNQINLQEKTIGIVGVGNVGSKVEKLCRTIGMNVLLNDPPRERKEGSGKFVSLDTIQKQADIITFHVPLYRFGKDITYHMADESFLQDLHKKPLVINSCRGEVTKNGAIKKALAQKMISEFIVDCWENEPDIDLQLLDLAMFGTPHIAGYSRDGKANGTTMSVQAISRYFKLGIDNWVPLNVELPDNTLIDIDCAGQNEGEVLAKAVLSTYKIENDDHDLRQNPVLFEQLRGDYPVRREFSSYSIKLKNAKSVTAEKLREMGFKNVTEDSGL